MSSAVVAQFVHKMAALRVPSDSRMAVALSGGPDSLALAALVAWWSGASESPQTPVCPGLQTVPAVFAKLQFAGNMACLVTSVSSSAVAGVNKCVSDTEVKQTQYVRPIVPQHRRERARCDYA